MAFVLFGRIKYPLKSVTVFVFIGVLVRIGDVFDLEGFIVIRFDLNSVLVNECQRDLFCLLLCKIYLFSLIYLLLFYMGKLVAFYIDPVVGYSLLGGVAPEGFLKVCTLAVDAVS